MNSLPSIFNDVIGPVMRGPSSSHTAASWRVARMAVQMINGPLKHALIEFDKDGAWVTNYEEQGTVLGMNGGLLEIDMADDLMKQTDRIASERGVSIDYQISAFDNSHANSMQLTLTSNQGDRIKVLAASLGGGSFEIQKIDECKVHMKGDYHELLVWSNSDIKKDLTAIKPPGVDLEHVKASEFILYIFKSSQPFDKVLKNHIAEYDEVHKVANVRAIMPVIAGKEKELPFSFICAAISHASRVAVVASLSLTNSPTMNPKLSSPPPTKSSSG